MNPLSLEKIATLATAKQHFSDCYLVSTISALSESENGIKILQKNIMEENGNFKIRFQNVNNKIEDFFVSRKEADDLILTDKYLNPISIEIPHNPVIKAIEIAMGKLIKKHPSKKSIINRIPNSHERFEYNYPSRFLEMFTGQKPIKLNESGIRMSLRHKMSETLNLFNRIASDKNSAFIAGTGTTFFSRLNAWHCYTINSIDITKNAIKLFDHRQLKEIEISPINAVNSLKFITGYFSKDLK